MDLARLDPGQLAYTDHMAPLLERDQKRVVHFVQDEQLWVYVSAGHYSLGRQADQHRVVTAEDAVTALTTGVECATQIVGLVGTEVTGVL